MNWKDNYIIKSLRSRPVLFGLTFFLGSLITYEITSTYTQREYEKRVEKQRETILKLETRVETLKTEMSKMNVVIVEEFTDKGILKKKLTKKESESSSSSQTKEETKTEVVEKEKEVVVEKEKVIRDIQKNHLYVGYGLDKDGDQTGSLGYMRTIGIFNIGAQLQSDQRFDDKAVLGTIGISF